MREFTKKLAIAAAAGALMSGIGAAWAQSDMKKDANDTPPTAADVQNSNHILNFRNQGNSPETDPAAHLILIHDHQPPVVAATGSSTTVADATPAPVDNTPPATTPDTSASSTDDSMNSTSTDTTDQTTDNSAAAMPAPRADRN